MINYKFSFRFLTAILLFVALCIAGGAFAQEGEGEAPEQVVTLSNVTTEQYGAFLKVTYDLETSDNLPTPIFGSFSTDGGATFLRWMNTVTGDANKEVAPVSVGFVELAKDGVTGLVEQTRARAGGLYPGMERELRHTFAGSGGRSDGPLPASRTAILMKIRNMKSFAQGSDVQMRDHLGPETIMV